MDKLKQHELTKKEMNNYEKSSVQRRRQFRAKNNAKLVIIKCVATKNR